MITKPLYVTLLLGATLVACDSAEPAGTTDMGMDMAKVEYTPLSCAFETTDAKRCVASTDYSPRLNMTMNSTWPKCVSDANSYVRVGSSDPSSAARTRAFADMGPLLWANPNAPSAADFTAARDKYAVAEGTGSRVQRRQDVHYPELPAGMKLSCADAANVAKYPDRCAGPAKLLPVINEAFQLGTAGTKPRLQAARIEASLIWFFYLSSLSEVWTCSFDNERDCDSTWAYYTAANQREQPIGLAKYYRDLSPDVHDRVFDAVLGVRCWSDAEGNKLPKTNQKLYCTAQNQLDRAELQGLALILKDRFGKLAAATAELKEAHMGFIGLLGGWLDRAARQRDPQQADILKAQWSAASADVVNAKAAQDALDALFSCS